MRVKPSFKTEHQVIKEEIGKRMDDFKSGIKDIVKQVIEEKDMGKSIEEVIDKKINEGVAPGTKIEKMIKEVRQRKGIETAATPASDINCPTCHDGHMHAMIENSNSNLGDGEKVHDGISYKCSDGKCGEEAVLISKKSDYKCTDCGVPLKRPIDIGKEKNLKGCPFCGSEKAVKFEWDKLWKVTGRGRRGMG